MDHRSLAVISSVLLIGLLAGCNSGNLDSVELPIPDAVEGSEGIDDQLKTLAVTATTDAESPAANSFEVPPSDASPQSVCKTFIELLNREQPEHYELLLTPAAINVSSRLKFHLPPLAEPGTRFELSEPAFNTIREKLCFIDCEFSASSDEEVSDVTVMMRKMKNGWRVAGMMIEGETPEAKNLISFESRVDVNQIKASVEVPADSTVD